MITTAILLSFFIPAASAEVAFVPILDRMASADVVVVGKITDIKKRAAHVTAVFDGQEQTRYFDIGAFKVIRLLKGPKWFSTSKVQIVFESGRLPGEYENMPDYRVYYKDGDEGIWFLRGSDSLPGKWTAGYDLQPLVPLSAETEVLTALKPPEAQHGVRSRKEAERIAQSYFALHVGCGAYTGISESREAWIVEGKFGFAGEPIEGFFIDKKTGRITSPIGPSYANETEMRSNAPK